MCERCDLLAAELAQMKDELAEWRRQASEERSVVVHGELRDRWSRTLRLAPLLSQAVILLVEREGRAVRYDAIARATCRHFDDLADPCTSAKVTVHKVRRAMAAVGINDGIETVWGVGYRMHPNAAAALRRVVFGPETPSIVGVAA